METRSIEKKQRQRGVVYLYPEYWRRLKRHRAETDKPVGQILEEAVDQHLETTPPNQSSPSIRPS